MTFTAPGSIRSVAWALVLVVGLAAAVIAGALPAGDPIAAGVVVGSQLVALACLVWRLRSTPPRPAAPWIVLLAGVVLSIVADGLATGEPTRWASSRPPLDVLYVVSYALIAAGIALAARSRGAGRDAGEIVDALIVMAAAGITVITLVAGVHVADATAVAPGAAALAVVLLDVVMIGLGALVFIRFARITVAIVLLGATLVAQLLADALLADGVLGGTVPPQSLAVLLGVMESVCFAAAMLHPTVADLLRVRPGGVPLPARVRLGVLTGVAVTAATVAILGQILGHVAGQVVGADSTTDVVTYVLVLTIITLFAIRAWILATEAERTAGALARTEANLDERSRFVAGISEAVPGVLFAGNLATLTLDYASPGLRTLLGVDPTSAIGKPGWIVERIHPEDREEVVALSRATRAAGTPSRTFEARMRTEDGGYRHIATTIRYLPESGGKSDRFVGIAIDVTDRVAAQADLEASRAFLEQLVATSPGIILRGRLSPRVVDFMSAGIQQVLGYRPDEVVGVEDWVLDHTHPEDAGPQAEALRELVAQRGGEATRLVRFRAVDGSYRALLITFRIRIGADDRPEYVASAIDVTEQQDMEARLREQERFVADIALTSAAVIFAGRAETDTIDFVSPSIERVLGYAPDEIVGVSGFFQAHVHPDDAALRLAQHGATVDIGTGDFAGVRRLRAKDGTYRHLVLATHVETDTAGVARYVSNALDISDRMELEDELVKARDRAEEASRAKTEFLSLVSHELRTPLNAILGFGELLERSHLSDEDRESVDYILEAGRNLLRLIDRILDYVRLESGRLRPDIGPVVPAAIVRRAVDGARPLASERGVTIEDLTAPFADLVCAGDGRRLVPIVDGLLDNAIRHGGPGVTVTASLAPHEGGGARIVVADDGVGMTEEQVADSLAPLSRNGIGTGVALGLSLARRLVEAMGGTLEIESQPGVGTSVSVSLPAWVEHAPPAPGDAAAGSGLSIGDGDAPGDSSPALGDTTTRAGGAG